MRLTTLCYIEREGCYLMLHRIRKDQDENAGKWIGIGGHLEEDESPEECIRREAREETGLELSDLRLRGILTFILPDWGNWNGFPSRTFRIFLFGKVTGFFCPCCRNVRTVFP